ncbi:hypothetical protein TTHERM_01132940 (macronuclear) [Tetrahymena thermophila SB210]|uniref:Uncharacterized protein n=1 Tax=Tetrahymena thermophila (strain SB210) TaxID=312017 RepID=Q24HT8_TETTS|nr:hypothetical protein TTHERM_01132940 [Tetrahymena thermophila SB210]EAS07349.1 hypothetical protein TTHERM_01132940 [Tetrahymena thermophila SB210]|eukprot:XP_001027591.1 hypothetical protein TTHERM_01132940 [Tetrahymena thermophila SB210]
MISSLQFTNSILQNTVSNVFTPNIQISNSINNNKNFFKQNAKFNAAAEQSQINQQNNQLLNQQQKQAKISYRLASQSNSESEIYEKSSQNYLSHFSSMIQIGQNNQQSSSQQSFSISLAKQKSIKESDFSLTSQASTNLAQNLNKKLAKLAKKQNSLSNSGCSTQISSCQSFNSIPSCKVMRPFPEHEFYLCAENLGKSTLTHIEEDESFELNPVIQVNTLSKNIQYVEYNKKKSVLSIHLSNKSSASSLDSLSSISFEEIPSSPHLYNSSELNSSISNLQNDLNNLPKVALPFNHTLLESETYKIMAQKTKPCLSVAYRLNENGSFDVKGIHMNEKFLIYTKWDTENCLLTTLNNSIQEMFTAKNYETFMDYTFKSMSTAFNAKSHASELYSLNGELRMADNGIREVEMSIQSNYNPKYGFLHVSYIIDRVISERKPVVIKKKSKSSIFCSTASSSKNDKSVSGGIRSQSSSIFKRKASNSFTFEDTTLGNDDESLSQQEKSFIQRFYSL